MPRIIRPLLHRYGIAAVSTVGAVALGSLILGSPGVEIALGVLAASSFFLYDRARRMEPPTNVAGDQLVAIVSEPSVIVSADMVVRAVNTAWAEIFDSPRSALVGASLTAPFVPRAAHSPLAMLVRRALAHGSAEDDITLDGITDWHLAAHRIVDSTGRAVLIRARDSAGHAQMEHELAQGNEALADMRALIAALGTSSIENLRERVAIAAAHRGDAALVVARADASRLVVLAGAGTHLRRGQGVPLASGDGVSDTVLEGGEQEWVRGDGAAPVLIERMMRTCRTALVVPIWRDDDLVGALAVASEREMDDHAREWVRTCGRILSLAEQGADHRSLRSRIAGRDVLTGLLNHRSFLEALRTALSAPGAHPVSVAIFNIDHFRQINELHGHETGDAVLVEVARRLGEEVADGETLGRISGEEFAVIMPGVGADAAEGAAEWLRSVISQSPISPVGDVTASAGIADSSQLDSRIDAGALMRLAGGAVFWAKEHGRNQLVRYDPSVIRELTPAERAQRIERAHALAALRALARVVDAKDQMTHRHAERVAHMAYRLALAAGWAPAAAGRLRDAALVHDVGKVAIPDAILHKPGPLDDVEMDQVREHSAIGATIVAEVLADDQADWVRAHHERWDGRGYPDGRQRGAIPEGAALIALADSWDVMTQPRPYRPIPLSAEEALAECRSGAGGQFAPFAVEALERMWDEGWIGADQSTPRAPRRVGPVDLVAP